MPTIEPSPTPTPTPTITSTPVQFSLYTPLTAVQVHTLIQTNPSVIIIDARAADEYTGKVKAGTSVGHVPGAYSVPDTGNITDQLYRFPDKTRPYICYCDSATCTHASSVALMLMSSGYTNVTIMQDGIGGWTADGYTLVTGG